jgi:hypothetical protein
MSLNEALKCRLLSSPGSLDFAQFAEVAHAQRRDEKNETCDAYSQQV